MRTPLRSLTTGLTLAALLAALLAACGVPATGPGPRPDPPTVCLSPGPEVLREGGARSSDWNDVLVTPDGRVWLAGYADGLVGQGTLDPSGDSRPVVRELDRGGAVLRDLGAALDTPGTDVAEALALGPDGRLHVAGRSTGTPAGTPNAGQFDGFIARTDPAAPNPAWHVAAFGGEGPEHPRRLRVDAAGRAFVAGHDDVFVPSNYVAAWEDPFVFAFTPGGAAAPFAPAWTHRADSSEPDTAEGLALGADGAVYLSGNVQAGARRGMYLRRLSPDGRAEWMARYSVVPVDNIAALHPLPDGSLLMAGSVFGSFRGGEWRGQQDLFAARVAPEDGRVLWSRQIGSEGSDWLTDLVVDADGNLHLLAETDGALAAGATPAGGADLALLKLSPAGEVLAARQWGTPAEEGARRLALDACGNAVVAASAFADGRREALVWFWRP